MFSSFCNAFLNLQRSAMERMLPVCSALQDVKIKVPQAVVSGGEAELQCSFELEDDKLYSVKWYRGQNEFFRYTPKEPEPVRVFDLKGIRVKLSESKDTKIVLENVTWEISGPFSCEVTADKPSFFTVMKTAHLQVVDVPLKEPYITGFKRRYSLEDGNFQANCTSEYSYPAANVSWHIDGYHVRESQVWVRTIKFERYVTVISKIQLLIPKKLFIDGHMRLRCTASLFNVYNKTTEVTVKLMDKRRRNRHPHWLVTTESTTTALIYDNLSEDKQESSIAKPRNFILWLLSPSSAPFETWPSSVVIIISLVINRILLR